MDTEGQPADTAGSPPETDIHARLAQAGALYDTGVAGVFGRGALYEEIHDRLAGCIRRLGPREAEVMAFPPVTPRADVERVRYFRNFPHLLGTVHAFCGEEPLHRTMLERHDAGEDWSGAQRATDLVLTPAACYPVTRVSPPGARRPRRAGRCTSGRTVSVASRPARPAGCNRSECVSM